MPVMTPDGRRQILNQSEKMKSFTQQKYFEGWLVESEKKLGCYADELSLCHFLLVQPADPALLDGSLGRRPAAR